jgi:hypothetical protein
MLPKLSERAHMRCTSNITRFYPEWKQAELRQTGGDALNDMLDFIDECTAHLVTLKERIAEGETPCIDTGWPSPDGVVETAPEPEVIEEIVEVPVEVVREVEDTARLEELEGRLKAALDALADRPETVEPDFEPKPDEPPASIADLFQPDKPLAPQAKALRELWLQIGHQIQRGEAKADEIRKHERLSSELEFINRHAFDGV